MPSVSQSRSNYVSSLLSRLQSSWHLLCQTAGRITQWFLKDRERCVMLVLFCTSLFLRLFRLYAALVGNNSVPFLTSAAQSALSASPWTTATSQLVLGTVAGITHNLGTTLVVLIVLNSLCVALLTHITTRWFGLRSGALAGLLLCLNPWAILASRTIGPEALLIPLSTLVLWGLELALAEKRPGGWIIALAASGIACGIHAIGLVLPITCLVLLLVFARRVSWRHAIVGILWAILLAIPPLHALNASGWATNSILDMTSSGADRLFAILATTSGDGLAAFLGQNSTPALPTALQALLKVWGWLTIISVPVGWYLTLWSWAHWRRQLDTFRFAAISTGCSVVLVCIIVSPIRTLLPHLVILLPWLAVSTALMIDILIPRLGYGHPAKVSAATIITLVVALLAGTHTYTALTVAEQSLGHPSESGAGLTLQYWHQTRDMVNRCVDEKMADQVWVLESREHDSLLPPEILAYEIEGVPFIPVNADTLPLTFDEPALVLIPPDRQTADDTQDACGKVLLPGQQKATLMTTIPTVDPTTLPIKDEAEATIITTGISYLGFETRNDSEPTLVIYWRMTPDASQTPITLYLDTTAIGELETGPTRPIRCANLSTEFATSLARDEHTLWAVVDNTRIELDKVTLQISAE